MSLRTLTEIADKQVKRALESVDGVGEVELSGGRAREVHIVVDVEKLNAYGLSIDQVRDAIQKENVEIPGGTIEQGKSELGLRTLGRIDATDQFNNIIIATVNGTPIRISDIGYAEDSIEKPTSTICLDDGKPAVQLDIRRASGENTIKVTDAVKQKLAAIQQALPKGVTLTLIRDDSRFIYASIASLEEHLLWGSLLAALVVMFFIRNIRAVIISALAIPASIVATFTLMRAMDFTLNNMTLLGLTLAVGIVIDDAIVVLENIFRYIEEKHCTPFEAAIQGTREVTLAVMATTLSLVVIFLPVAFMTGYARRFIYPFGWTMAFSILVSMLVSFTLTPMLSSRFLKLSDADGDSKTKESGFFRKVDEWYTAIAASGRSRTRWRSSASPLVVFALTFPLNRMVGRTFIPERGHGRVHGPPRHAGRHVARGHDRGRRRAVAKELRDLEGVAHIEYLSGVRQGQPRASSSVPLAARRAQGHAGRRWWRGCGQILAAHPGYNADHRRAQPARRRRAGRRFRFRPTCWARTWTSCPTTRCSSWRRRSRRRASSMRRRASATAAPRFGSPSTARARPISACGCRRSATRCG